MNKLFTSGKYKVGAHEFELARNVRCGDGIYAKDFVSIDGRTNVTDGDAVPKWLGEVLMNGADAEKVSG